MKRITTFAFLFASAWLLIAASSAWALDPPHNDVNGINCNNCHTPHHASGGTITKAAGNPNLCMTCHTAGGLATNKAFADSDQAYPGQIGTSHRFDSGPSGHVERSLSNTSTGSIESGGAFTGRIEKTYTIRIATGGEVGTATFTWTADLGGSGSGTSGSGITLADGLTLTFTNGTPTPSFVAGDVWTLDVRTDLRLPIAGDPFEGRMAARVANGKVVCSVCHDQHSQVKTPADPSAPAYGGAGTGWGRHYQRQDNDSNQICHVCHSVRNVPSSTQGSHPVGIAIPSSGYFQTPANLQLVNGNVDCTTCHSPHFTTSGGANSGQGDGYLLDQSIGDLCYQCHTIGDRSTASHLNTTTGALWPGGQYGSTKPALSSGYKGFCVNCHWPHGWPDSADTTKDYPKLWAERYDTKSDGTDPDDAENLCYTCHDGSPATTNVRGQFLKGTNAVNTTYHHPIKDSEQVSQSTTEGTTLRSVECINCHNPHRATSTDKLKGVTGVDAAGNAVGPGTANDRDIAEYELCFKCHGDTYNSGRPARTNKRLDFATTNTAFHPVEAQGRNQSQNLQDALLGGLATTSTIRCTDCHNNEATKDVKGSAQNSTQKPKGPHGSTNAQIRRGAYFTSEASGPSSFNQANFELCFLCHDVSKLTAQQWGSGARTNFYDGINGKDNLHWLHLIDRISDSRAVCKNCHYNVHSNLTAGNTQYNVNGVVATSPPAGTKTHLINFSPEILPIGGRAKPEWWINTATRERRCYLSCHGFTMSGFQYRPNRSGVTNGGDDAPTY